MLRRFLVLLVLAAGLTACAGAHRTVSLSRTSAPPSTRWVGTHGIEVAVPADWRDNRGRCGTPRANTVLWNEDGVLDCVIPQPPGLSVVEFGGILGKRPGWHARNAIRETIGGASVLRLPASRVAGSREVQLELPRRGISLTILSPHRALLNRIVASLRAVHVDGNGCPVRAPSGGFRLGSRPGGAPLVRGDAVRVLGCSYHGIWLDQSNQLGRFAAIRLARALNAARYGFSRSPRNSILPSLCDPSWRGNVITARFEYADEQRPVVVTAHVQGCSRLGASNGRWTVRIAQTWVFQLVTGAHFFGDFVDPRTAR